MHSIVRWLLLAGLLGSVITGDFGISEWQGTWDPWPAICQDNNIYCTSSITCRDNSIHRKSKGDFQCREHAQSCTEVFSCRTHFSYAACCHFNYNCDIYRVKKAISEAQAARSLLWFYLISLVINSDSDSLAIYSIRRTLFCRFDFIVNYELP